MPLDPDTIEKYARAMMMKSAAKEVLEESEDILREAQEEFIDNMITENKEDNDNGS